MSVLNLRGEEPLAEEPDEEITLPETPPGLDAIRAWLRKPRPWLHGVRLWIQWILSGGPEAWRLLKKHGPPAAARLRKGLREIAARGAPVTRILASIGEFLHKLGAKISAAAHTFRETQGKKTPTQAKIRETGETAQHLGDLITAVAKLAGMVFSFLGRLMGLSGSETAASLDILPGHPKRPEAPTPRILPPPEPRPEKSPTEVSPESRRRTVAFDQEGEDIPPEPEPQPEPPIEPPPEPAPPEPSPEPQPEPPAEPQPELPTPEPSPDLLPPAPEPQPEPPAEPLPEPAPPEPSPAPLPPEPAPDPDPATSPPPESPEAAPPAPPPKPALPDLEGLPRVLHPRVRAIGPRPLREVLRVLILDICLLREWTTAAELAGWVSMHQPSLVARHIRPLVEADLLKLQFADQPNSPLQAYQTRKDRWPPRN